jgi:hypothetical protein
MSGPGSVNGLIRTRGEMAPRVPANRCPPWSTTTMDAE